MNAMCMFLSFRCILFISSCYLDKHPSLHEQFWYPSLGDGYRNRNVQRRLYIIINSSIWIMFFCFLHICSVYDTNLYLVWGSSFEYLESVKYVFIAITPRSTLTQSEGSCENSIYRPNKAESPYRSAEVLGFDLEVNEFKSSRAISFIFGLIPLGKAWTPLFFPAMDQIVSHFFTNDGFSF